MNLLAFCFGIALLNSVIGEHTLVRYNLTLTVEDDVIRLLIFEERMIQQVDDEYKSGRFLYFDKQFFNKEYVTNNLLDDNNKISLDFKCPGGGKRVTLEAAFPPTILDDNRKPIKNTNTKTITANKEENIFKFEIERITDEQFPDSFIIKNKNILNTDEKRANAIFYPIQDPEAHVFCLFDYDLRYKRNVINIKEKESEVSSYVVNLVEKDKVQYKLELKDNISDNHKFGLEIKETGEEPQKTRNSQSYTGEIQIIDRPQEGWDKIVVNFQCPDKGVTNKLTLLKKNNYGITNIEYLFLYEKYNKNIEGANLMVDCYVDDDVNLFEELDVSIVFSSPGTLELNASMINLDSVVYEFQLDRVKNEDKDGAKIELKIEEKGLAPLDKKAPRSHLHYRGGLEIDNSSESTLNLIYVYFECPGSERGYRLTFEENKEKTGYVIINYEYAPDKHNREDFYKKNSLVYCYALIPDEFIEQLYISKMPSPHLPDSTSSNALHLEVNMIRPYSIYEIRLRQKDEGNKIELNMKEVHIEPTGQENQKPINHRADIVSDKSIVSGVNEIRVDFKCPDKDSIYNWTFIKKSKTNEYTSSTANPSIFYLPENIDKNNSLARCSLDKWESSIQLEVTIRYSAYESGKQQSMPRKMVKEFMAIVKRS